MSLFGKKEASPQETAPSPTPAPAPPRPAAPPVPETRPAPAPVVPQRTSQTHLGSTFCIKGDITAEENITVDGIVEGTIETTQNVVIAPEGRVKANIRASVISISGKVRGNVVATNKVDIAASGQLEGNIHAPKLSIAESALFKGSIDMSAPGAPDSKK